MKKILIVDDQEAIRALVEITLRGKGYVLLQADSGQRAIDITKKEKPDVVIMDIMMPGKIDGLTAVRKLKSNPLTKDTNIILLTVKGQEEDKMKGFEAGADDYCVKPFKPDEIIKKIEAIFGE